MELFMQGVEFMKTPCILTIVWFIFTCVNAYFHKKVTYYCEMVVLFINAIWTLCLAFVSIIHEDPAENAIILVAWAASFIMLGFIVIKDYGVRYMSEKI